LGFRGPEWPREKDEGTLRIALIGDSVAFGFGVHSKETVGELLPETLSRLGGPTSEVLNFGVNGYNSHQQRAVFEEYALKLDPDLIILLPANNDHKRPLLVDGDGWLHWDGSNTENTRVTDKSIKRMSRQRLPAWASRSRALLYLSLWRGKSALSEAPKTAREAVDEPRRDWMGAFTAGPISDRLRESVYGPIREMLLTADGYGIPVIIAHYCASPDYRRMFQILAAEEQVPVLELLALFPEVGSLAEFTAEFGLGWDSHPNSEAQRRWAEALGELVVSMQLDAAHGPLPAQSR